MILIKTKKLTPIVADENKQIQIMMQKAMKGIEDPLKSLLGTHYKPVYRIVVLIVLLLIILIVITAIILQFS